MSALPVPAATVLLLRDAAPSLEVLLLRRSARSDWLPDLYVFPGGRVEDGDYELAGRIADLEPGAISARVPELSPTQAVGYCVAAIRETFEEAGILLARKRGSRDFVAGDLLRDLVAERLACQSGDTSFADLVEAHDLELCGGALAIHARWITPERVPQRFDTLFFTAIAPAGQRAAPDGEESTHHVWIRPADALAEASRGERQIIFPTLCNLESVCELASANEVLAASRARRVVPVMPRIVADASGRKLVIPTDAGYRTSEAPIPGAG